MRARRWVAGAILLSWVAVLAAHARREYFPPAGRRLAEAALTLPPGVAYYALYRGEARAGWGQRELDTLPGAAGFVVRERWAVELPGLGETGRAELRGEARLDARLRPRSFEHVAVTGRGTTTVEGRMEGDSVLTVSVRTSGGLETRRLPAGDGLLLPASWPLRLAALGAAEPGDRYEVRILDPVAAAVRRTELRILERSLRSFPDSADLDTLEGRWFVAREDTVAAWRVARGGGVEEVIEWVDEDGRLVEGELPGGVRMERTAFELAFYLRPGAPSVPGAAAARPTRPPAGEEER